MACRSDTRANVLTIGAVAVLIACLGVLTVWRQQVPGEVVGVISTVAGIAGTCLRDAFQYEFGRSRGSREKDALLAQRAAAQDDAPTP